MKQLQTVWFCSSRVLSTEGNGSVLMNRSPSGSNSNGRTGRSTYQQGARGTQNTRPPLQSVQAARAIPFQCSPASWSRSNVPASLARSPALCLIVGDGNPNPQDDCCAGCRPGVLNMLGALQHKRAGRVVHPRTPAAYVSSTSITAALVGCAPNLYLRLSMALKNESQLRPNKASSMPLRTRGP